MIKGVFENYSSMKKILVLIVLMLLGLCMASVFTGILAQMNIEKSTLYRSVQFLSLLGLFIIPSFLGAYLFSSDWKAYLYLDRNVSLQNICYTIVLTIALQPFLAWVVYLNNQIALPDCLSGLEAILRSMESNAEQNISLILTTDSIGVFLLNVLLVSVLTAIGEEAFFRGALQRILLNETKRPWVAIVVIAIIFSAIHFQFYGFFARMLLGLLLGYLVYASKSLILPIIAHAVNNLIAIIQIHLDNVYEVDESHYLNPRGIVLIASVFISAFLLRLLIRSFRRERIDKQSIV